MFYDFTVKDSAGKDISLKNYMGKVLLIVNTATHCGLTPQYQQLQKLYDMFHAQGFEILDFPCNQFLQQAPGTDEEIQKFCHTNYGTRFSTFSKIEVNGQNAHPLYVYLKEQQPHDLEDADTPAFQAKLESLGQHRQDNEILWNFTKFLVDRQGTVVARYAPNIEPETIAVEIEQLL